MTQSDFASMVPSADSPARLLVAITFDSAPSQGILRGIYNQATAAKDVAVTLMDDSSITIKNIPSGQIFPVFCKKVNTSGTTALATELLGVI